MLNEILNITEEKLNKSVVTLKGEFSKIVLDRANIGLIEGIKIICYGEKYSLTQLSVISFEGVNVILIKPFDKKNSSVICKEIVNLNLDLNPFASDDVIRVTFPKLTSERREFFAKKVKKMCEDIKISIRNIRRQSNQKIKGLLKNNDISKDEERVLLNDIDVLINKYIVKVEFLSGKKVKELLSF